MSMFKKLVYIWNMNNNLKYLMRGTIFSIASLFITGSIIQAFMLEKNIKEKSVAYYVSALQIVQVSVMLLISPVVDRFKNIIKLKSVLILFQVTYTALLAFIAVSPWMKSETKYAFILIGGIIISVVQAVNNIIYYKVPYLILDLNDYGHLNGKVGILSGIIGALFSALLSYLTGIFNYNKVMFVMFIIASAAIILTFLTVISYKPINELERKGTKDQKKNINIFKYKPFYILLLPNLLRGFAAGIFGTAMTIGFYVGVTDKSSGSTMALVLQIATLVSSYVYTITSKRKLDDKILLISSIMMTISISFMLVGGNLTVFYVMYLIASFFINIVNNAVPTAVVKIVDYDHIGQYTTWRMLCHTLGGAVASAVAMSMIDLLGGILTMVIAALCQLISGSVYYIYIQILKKQNKYIN